MVNTKLKICIGLILLMILSSCSYSSPSTRFQGYVEGELTYIASPYGGQLKQLFVDRGAIVTLNEKLFVLEPEPQSYQYQQAQENLHSATATLANLQKGGRQTILEALRAQIDQAQANLALTQIRLARTQKLLAKNAASQDEYDQALAAYKSQVELVKQLQANLKEAALGSREDVIEAQKFSVAAAKARLQEALWILAQKTQYAPASGMIFDKYFHLGEFVPAAQPVLSILTPNNINIIFFLPEQLLAKVKIGAEVNISCDGCNKTYRAKIYYISPKAEYTPPVIYSRESNYKLVYRIRAKPLSAPTFYFHPGQPVYVSLIKQ